MRFGISAVNVSSLCLCLMTFPTKAFGGPQVGAWVPPSNVRVVQRDGADNIRIFTSIQQAMQSITDASASNPYLIKVMPGTYDGVDPKPYVSIQGSGISQTVLPYAHVTLAALRDVSVQNNWVTLYDGAILERVRVHPTNPVGYAVLVNASAGTVQIIDSDLQVTDCAYYTEAAAIYSTGPFEIKGSTVKSCAFGIDTMTNDIQTTLVNDSRIEGSVAPLRVRSGYAGQDKVVVRNSVMAGPNALVLPPPISPSLSVMFAGSEIGGSTSAFRPGIDKIVHSYGSNFNPVPNL